MSSLLSDDRRDGFEAENREQQTRLREQHSARRERPLLAYEAALKNRARIDWAHDTPPEPAFLGRRVLEDVPLDELVPYIDWTFFFAAWELKGRFPAILRASAVRPGGARAVRQRPHAARSHRRRAAADGERRLRLLARRERGRRHRRVPRSGAVGRARAIQHAAAAGGDRRRQAESLARRFHRAATALPAGRSDYLGAFAVTAGLGAEDLAQGVRARARRLQRDSGQGAGRSPRRGVRRLPAREGARRTGASTSAERPTTSSPRRIAASVPASATRRVRITARSSSCSSCSAPRASASQLTDHAAMTPAASVSGLYFAHPAGAVLQRRPPRRGSDRRTTRKRKGQSIDEVERWLAPNLAYEPARC